jgi:hypothetical protein
LLLGKGVQKKGHVKPRSRAALQSGGVKPGEQWTVRGNVQKWLTGA